MRNLKKWLLPLIGVLPLASGYAMNSLMMERPNWTPPYFLISVGFLLIWILLGLLSGRLTGSCREAVLLINAMGLLDVILVAVQIAVLGQFWMNGLGIATQFYFLPVIWLSARLVPSVPMVVTIVVCFALLCGATALGHRLHGGLRKQKK